MNANRTMIHYLNYKGGDLASSTELFEILPGADKGCYRVVNLSLESKIFFDILCCEHVFPFSIS